jgi:hypothetical protein
MKLTQLKKALRQNDIERKELEAQLEETRVKKVIPKLKAQYEGKYFKSENAYDSSSKWPVYHYVKEVVSEGEATVAVFEYIPDYGYRFNMSTEHCMYLLTNEITKEEFHKAALKMVSNAFKFNFF